MKVRNPYVDPLNVLQAEIMKRLRKDTGADATTSDLAKEQRITLEDALIVSVNGIAQGMKNSG
jgi:phosphoenolpyruvate carboxylase